jgi:hypothetical protein
LQKKSVKTWLKNFKLFEWRVLAVNSTHLIPTNLVGKYKSITITPTKIIYHHLKEAKFITLTSASLRMDFSVKKAVF